jgi:hypothetical protein
MGHGEVAAAAQDQAARADTGKAAMFGWSMAVSSAGVDGRRRQAVWACRQPASTAAASKPVQDRRDGLHDNLIGDKPHPLHKSRENPILHRNTNPIRVLCR